MNKNTTKTFLISWGVYPLLTGSSVIVNNITSQFTPNLIQF